MICKNKGLTKKILTYHRVKVPDFAIFPCGKPIHRPKRLKYPVFIKPLRDQGSYGIAQASFVESNADFIERVHFIHERFHQDAIAEEYIEGRELYVSILGNERLEVFPVREMIFSEIPDEEPKFATFKAKWDQEYRKRWGIKNTFANNFPEETPEDIAVLAKKVYHALQIRGYARLDLRLTPEGAIVVIEANPNPMLAKDEDFSLSAQKGGIEYPQLIQRILNLALRSQE
jgi:D-alanine-D-alanine ligase